MIINGKTFVALSFFNMGLYSLYLGDTRGMCIVFAAIPLIWLPEICNYLIPDRSTKVVVSSSMKHRIINLSNLVGSSPAPADLTGVNDCCDSYDDLVQYLDETVVGCSYLKTIEKLREIAPDIELVINNKQLEPMSFEHYNPESIDIYVEVCDKAWIGVPTSNTMISRVG